MDHGGLAIATGAAAHLVKLNAAKRHVIEHDMANIGKVDALAKGGCRDDAAEAAVSKRLLYAMTVGARKARVVKGDMRRTVGNAFA